MAIDYMVMPLSRYIAGDFITPAMEMAWSLGTPYTQIGPSGVRTFPPNTPFGGPEAAHQRSQIADDVRAQLAPLFDPLPWDEDSSVAPRFHRTDARSQAVLEEYLTAGHKPTFFGRLFGRSKAPPQLEHVFGTLFVPAPLPRVVQIEQPVVAIVASIPAALAALDAACPPEAEFARDTLRAALTDANELGLPMIVDA